MENKIDKLFQFVDVFTGIVTGAMVFFVFLNVFLRILFGAGLTWSEELARYLFVFVTYVGSISAMNSNEHLGVDTLIVNLNKKVQLVLYIVSQLIITILMTFLIHGTISMMIYNSSLRTASLNILFPVLYSLGLLLGASVTLIAIRNIYYALKHKDKITSLVRFSEEEELVEQTQLNTKEGLDDMEDT